MSRPVQKPMVRTLKSNEKFYVGSSHTVDFIKPVRLKKYIKAAKRQLKKLDKNYDTLAFAGISGAIIGPTMALEMGKETILVRKDGDKRHSWHEVCGYQECDKYIIIDDFVDSGKTVKMIQKKIYEFAPEAECIGVLSVQELTGTGHYLQRSELETKYNLTKAKLEK